MSPLSLTVALTTLASLALSHPLPDDHSQASSKESSKPKTHIHLVTDTGEEEMRAYIEYLRQRDAFLQMSANIGGRVALDDEQERDEDERSMHVRQPKRIRFNRAAEKKEEEKEPQLTYFPVEGSEPQKMMDEMKESQAKMGEMRAKVRESYSKNLAKAIMLLGDRDHQSRPFRGDVSYGK